MSRYQENQVFMLPFLNREYPVSVAVNSYLHNRNLFVGLVIDEDGYMEPFADMTVNISDLPPYHAALDTNNLPGVTSFVEKEGLGKPTGQSLASGFCRYPVYEFSKEALQALDPKGCAEYERHLSDHTQVQPRDMVQEIEEVIGEKVEVIDLTMQEM